MSCRPPPNSTYLAIGQDLFSIDEYVKSQYNYSLHHPSSNNDSATNGTLNSISNFVPSGEGFSRIPLVRYSSFPSPIADNDRQRTSSAHITQ
jgi:hypothetical protein